MINYNSDRLCFFFGWILLVLFQTTLWGCSSSQNQLFLSQAKDEVAKIFAEQVVSDSRCKKIRQIGVMPIENDMDGSMHEALSRRLVNFTSWDVTPLLTSKTMKKIIEVIGKTVDKGEIYDPKTLIKLGKMTQSHYVVYGAITTYSIGHRDTWVNFKGQIFDLERGVILFFTDIKGNFHRPFNFKDVVFILIGLVLICLVSGFLSRQNYFAHEKKKQAILWGFFLIIWGLAIFWYYCPYL